MTTGSECISPARLPNGMKSSRANERNGSEKKKKKENGPQEFHVAKSAKASRLPDEYSGIPLHYANTTRNERSQRSISSLLNRCPTDVQTRKTRGRDRRQSLIETLPRC